MTNLLGVKLTGSPCLKFCGRDARCLFLFGDFTGSGNDSLSSPSLCSLLRNLLNASSLFTAGTSLSINACAGSAFEAYF